MKNKRKLVGRRFDDFLQHDILLELSTAEKIWHNLITDIRYQSILDRRRLIRRQEEVPNRSGDEIFRPLAALYYYPDINF